MANENPISIDEFLNRRKAHVDKSGHLVKASVATDEKGAAPLSLNKETGECRFTMSAEVVDRDKDVVHQAGLDLKEFLKNPVAPFAHQTRGFPIGQWKDVEVKATGRPPRTEGTLVPTKGDKDADRLIVHLEAGSIRACSIGFMPKRIKERVEEQVANTYSWPGYDILEAELYECSPCMIPANPAALAKAAQEHGMLGVDILAEVLDTWTNVSGLIVPRKAFEEEHAKHTAGRTFSFGGHTFKSLEHGKAELIVPAAPQESSLVKRLAKIFGLGDDATKDPTSLQDILVKSEATGGTEPSPTTANQETAPEPEAPIIPIEDVKALEEMDEILTLEAEHLLLEDDITKTLAA